jgi:hypothetical protein
MPYSRWVLSVLTPVLLCLQGCESLQVPVGDPERSRISADITGVWFVSFDDDGEMGWLAVLEPFDRRTWLGKLFSVNSPSGVGDVEVVMNDPAMFLDRAFGEDVQLEGPVVFKTWIAKLGGERFLVLEAKGVIGGDRGFGSGEWQVARVRLTDDDTMHVAVVDAEFENLDDVTTSRQAEAIIRRNVHNPKLYGFDEIEEKGLTFKRVPQSQLDRVAELLDEKVHNRGN